MNYLLNSLALLAFVCTAAATAIPAGTELHLRLLDPIASATAKPLQVVQAAVIAPELAEGKIAIPQGASVAITLREVKAAGDSGRAIVAFGALTLSWNGFKATLDAHVSALDNARETLDADHRIFGIAADETLTSKIDKGIGKLSQKYGGFGAVLEAAKTAIVKKADPEINYPVGVEFSVTLDKPLDLPDAKLTGGPSLDFSDDSKLPALVLRQTFRAYSLHPVQPSDLTNLMFVGTEEQLTRAFNEAGWFPASALDASSKLETVLAVLEDRGYKEGPVSILTLDSQPPALVFQKNNNTFAARHHLRIWRRPVTFEGLPVWVCAATHDIGIDYSESDHTFIHKIDSHIDNERAKVVNDLIFTGLVRSVALVERPNVPQNAENATGDHLITDGAMAVLLLGARK